MSHDQDVLEQHRVAFEPPDLITSFPTGTLTLEATRIVWQFVDASSAQTDRFYWLSDISRLERYAAGDHGVLVRKVMAKLVGAAIVGGNFQQRTIMSVLFRAGRLLGITRTDACVEFFENESSARAWVDSLRKKQAATSH